jgi:hypothetical protein
MEDEATLKAREKKKKMSEEASYATTKEKERIRVEENKDAKLKKEKEEYEINKIPTPLSDQRNISFDLSHESRESYKCDII